MRLCESPTTTLSGNGKVLRGLFAECDTLNQNERIYPDKVYIPALEGILPKIKEGRLLGELDHPEYDEVRLSNVSHVIRECYVEGKKIYGTVELLDTPAGKIAQALNEAGIPLGISSRGVGDTRRVREGDEVTNLTLITYDLVADPSFSNAILSESKKVLLKSRLDDVARSLPLNESVSDNSRIRAKIDSIKQDVDKMPDATVELVESIGALTKDNRALNKSIRESNLRNESLQNNMSILQESYNLLSESVRSIESKNAKEIKSLKENHSKEIKILEETHFKEIKSLKETYAREVSSVKELHKSELGSLNEEIVSLRKQLAIEKRGLDASKFIPMLEGVTSVDDIEHKLDSFRNISTRRQISTTKEGMSALTEGITSRSKSTKLSKVVASV